MYRRLHTRERFGGYFRKFYYWKRWYDQTNFRCVSVINGDRIYRARHTLYMRARWIFMRFFFRSRSLLKWRDFAFHVILWCFIQKVEHLVSFWRSCDTNDRCVRVRKVMVLHTVVYRFVWVFESKNFNKSISKLIKVLANSRSQYHPLSNGSRVRKRDYINYLFDLIFSCVLDEGRANVDSAKNFPVLTRFFFRGTKIALLCRIASREMCSRYNLRRFAKITSENTYLDTGGLFRPRPFL